VHLEIAFSRVAAQWSAVMLASQLAEHLRDFDCEEASGVFDQALQQCSSWLPGWMQVCTSIRLCVDLSSDGLQRHGTFVAMFQPGTMCGTQGQQAADTAKAGAERMVAKIPDSAVKVDEAQVCGRQNVRVLRLHGCPLRSHTKHL